jgi:integrase
MKARGRSVWQNSKTGKWIAEARVPVLGGGYKKAQRTAENEAEAAELAETLYRDLKLKASSKVPGTLRELVQNYLELNQNYSRAGTLANNKYLLDKYVLPDFGSRKPEAFTAIALLGLMKKLRSAGLATSTINKIRAVVSVVYATSIGYGLDVTNPAATVRPFWKPDDEQTQVQEPWTIEEVKLAHQAFSGTQLDAFIHISTSLGMRKGEILGLRWKDIDLEEGIIHVRQNRGSRRAMDQDDKTITRMVSGPLKTKSSERKLKLTSLVGVALMRQRELQSAMGYSARPEDYIILGQNGGPIHEASLYKIYNRICAEAGLRRIRIHDHRHSAAVIALSMKVDPIVVSYGLGHASFEITKRIYAQTVPLLSSEFSDLLGEALSSQEGLPRVNDGGGVNVQ